MTPLNLIDRDHLTAQLIRHEGLRLFLYIDTVGKPTIGVGRNVEDVGISQDEAMALLDHDIDRVVRGLTNAYSGWFLKLDPVRQAALVNMAFNLGLKGFGGFKEMIAAIDRGEMDAAADQMLASKWAQQTGHRAAELAEQMRTGQWA